MKNNVCTQSSQVKRTMVRFERTDNCITIQTVARKNGHREHTKSDRFYVSKDSIKELFEKGYIISQDIYSFLKMYKSNDEKVLYMDFTWLESNGHTVKGRHERLELDFKGFEDWFNSDVLTHRQLDRIDNIVPKITFNSSKNLKEVLGNRQIKRKFIKRLMQFQNPRCTEVVFCDDYIPYSFGFSRYINGKYEMCGGLICHKDYENPDDLSKARYSVHT